MSKSIIIENTNPSANKPTKRKYVRKTDKQKEQEAAKKAKLAEKKAKAKEKAKAKKAAKLQKLAALKAKKAAKKLAAKEKLEAKKIRLAEKKAAKKAKLLAKKVKIAEKKAKAKEKAKVKKMAMKLKAKNAKKQKLPKKNKVEKLDAPVNDIKVALKNDKELIKTLQKRMKTWAKDLAKESDEDRNNILMKLTKIGFEFDVTNPTELRIKFTADYPIVPKMKKLNPGAKAVEVKKVAEIKPEPVVEDATIESVSAEQPNSFEDEPEVQNPIEIPVGDTFTDDNIDPVDVAGETDDEDVDPNASSSDSDSEDEMDMLPSEDDDKADYRKEFFDGLAAEGDDSNM